MIKIADILTFLEKDGVQFHFYGNAEELVDGFSSLANYKNGSFTWIKTEKNIPEDMDISKITLAFVQEGINGNFKNSILSPNSKYAFFTVIEHFYEEKREGPSVGQYTYISPGVKLGENVRIGHNCTLDGDITIGDNTVIWHGVTIINRVSIGKNCEIRSGAVIGHDGYSYTEDDTHKKIMVKHFGGVRIGDYVTLCEQAMVCRGTIDDTVIESGVKIDILSHISHNSKVGANSAFAGFCRLGGSTVVGKNVYLVNCLTRNQIHIGDNAFGGTGALIVKDVNENESVMGVPAKPFHRKSE